MLHIYLLRGPVKENLVLSASVFGMELAVQLQTRCVVRGAIVMFMLHLRRMSSFRHSLL